MSNTTHARRDLLIGLGASGTFVVLNVLRIGPFDFSNIEVAAFVTGAWSVWLVVRNDIWNWPLAIANGAIFVWLFVDARLYADAGINAFYIVAGAYGWWFWLRGGARRTERPIARTPLREWLIIVVAVGLGTWWMYGHLISLGDAAPFLDAVTTSVSIAAFWMQARRYIDQWYLWIAVDLVYVPLYVWKSLPLTGALYVIFLSMCVIGLHDWRRQIAERPVTRTRVERTRPGRPIGGAAG